MKLAPFWSAVWRVLRVAIAIFVAGLVAKYSHENWWLLLAPVLNGLAKYLRDKFGLDIIIL